MSKSGASKNGDREIAELEAEKRSSIIQGAIALVVIIVLFAFRQFLLMNNMVSSDDFLPLMATYVVALVGAGFVGIKAMKWSQANSKIAQVQQRRENKKKKRRK